jgi:hypothetical protein
MMAVTNFINSPQCWDVNQGRVLDEALEELEYA